MLNVTQAPKAYVPNDFPVWSFVKLFDFNGGSYYNYFVDSKYPHVVCVVWEGNATTSNSGLLYPQVNYTGSTYQTVIKDLDANIFANTDGKGDNLELLVFADDHWTTNYVRGDYTLDLSYDQKTAVQNAIEMEIPFEVWVSDGDVPMMRICYNYGSGKMPVDVTWYYD